MGEVAEVLDGTGGEAGAPEGGAAPAGDAGSQQPEGGASQPTGEAPAAEAKGPEAGTEQPKPGEPPQQADGPDPVPYKTFREARARGTALRRQMAEAEQTWGSEKQGYETRLGEQDTRIKELETGRSAQDRDYRLLSVALQRNPDVADVLAERLKANPISESALGIPGAGSARRSAESTPPADPRFDQWGRTLDRMDQRLTAQEQREADASKKAQEDEIEREVGTRVNTFLGDKGYDKAFAGDLTSYVMMRLASMEDADYDDIKWLANEWYKRTETAIQGRVNTLMDGKVRDRGLPPSPGAQGGPVRATPNVGANDATTAAAAEEALRQKLNWT